MFYTYLIKCNPTNEFYYGVRYSRKADSKELWKSYFTSSKVVKERISIFGKDAFTYSIRRVFTCSKKARIWEDKVLRRLKVIERPEFLNKNYGICFDQRGTIKGMKMVKFLKTGEFRMVERNMALYLVNEGIAVLKGLDKPEDFGMKVSLGLKGYKKTLQHLKNISSSQKGRKYGTLEERYGVVRANEISEKISISVSKYNEHNTSPSKGKTYEEIYGTEKAGKLKEARSLVLKNNNPGKKMKGKTYEELYGSEQAAILKENRSKVGKSNRKVYVVYEEGIEVFRGERLEAEKFISKQFQLPRSNILYKKELLNSNNIMVETLKEHH